MKRTLRARGLTILLVFSLGLLSAWHVTAQDLQEVLDPPSLGTFYLMSLESDDRPSPPYPFDPYEGALPVYAVAGFNGVYLVADSPEDYQVLQLKLAAERAESMSLMEGMGFSSLEGGFEFGLLSYGSNDLWLEIVGVTNGAASFTIHTPDTAAYDLFGTTNLCADVPGLNATNWAWLLRTGSGETNNIVATNLWTGLGFFRLGTMLDQDMDDLTDAFERLVSHTDPLDPDTDCDGLSDGAEWFGSSDPLVPAPVPALSSRTVFCCPVP